MLKIITPLLSILLVIRTNFKTTEAKLANVGDYPYQLSVQLDYIDVQHLCGGIIISDLYALTSASCLYGVQPAWSAVVAGTTEVTHGYKYHIKTFTRHPNYHYFGYDYDVAVLELSAPFNFSVAEIKPIRIGSRSPDTGSVGTVSGFGDGKVLRSQDVFIMEKQNCTDNFKDQYTITDRMFCSTVSGGSFCKSDGGGPLVVNGYLLGIISGQNKCGIEGHPGIYTDITTVMDFIANVTEITAEEGDNDDSNNTTEKPGSGHAFKGNVLLLICILVFLKLVK